MPTAYCGFLYLLTFIMLEVILITKASKYTFFNSGIYYPRRESFVTGSINRKLKHTSIIIGCRANGVSDVLSNAKLFLMPNYAKKTVISEINTTFAECSLHLNEAIT